MRLYVMVPYFDSSSVMGLMYFADTLSASMISANRFSDGLESMWCSLYDWCSNASEWFLVILRQKRRRQKSTANEGEMANAGSREFLAKKKKPSF